MCIRVTQELYQIFHVYGGCPSNCLSKSVVKNQWPESHNGPSKISELADLMGLQNVKLAKKIINTLGYLGVRCTATEV